MVLSWNHEVHLRYSYTWSQKEFLVSKGLDVEYERKKRIKVDTYCKSEWWGPWEVTQM